MATMNFKMLEIQNEITNLKSTKVMDESSPEQSPRLKEKGSQDKNILNMKVEIAKKDEIIKAKIDKCKVLEAKVIEKTTENEKLVKVAGEMFNDLKDLKAPHFNTKEYKNNAKIEESNPAISSQVKKGSKK